MLMNPPWNARRRAFTLIEVLVAMTVLALLVALIAQMTSGVTSVVNRGQGHVETDEQARALLDRMAIDFAAIVKRPDVDYYLKGRPVELNQAGNDQIAFYSEVPGYFPASTPPSTGATSPSPVSLVAYRVNSDTMRMERLSKGLAWNGASTATSLSMAFLPVPLASPVPVSSPVPSPTPATTSPLFPVAADPTAQDPDYEELGPQVFRFEYYYVLKGQGSTSAPPVLSLTPWYVNPPVNHTSVNGLQDVAGIGVVIAVIDSKSRALVTKDQLLTLAGQMDDATVPAANPTGGSATPFAIAGDIEQKWLAKVNASSLPKPAIAAIRIYTRCFYLNGVTP